MKQKKISYWLKGLVVVLMFLGVIFWGGVTWLSISYSQILDVVPAYDWKYFAVVAHYIYTAFFYFAILVQFWKVCTEIGRDNSFSLENAKSFHLMGIFAGAEAVGFLVRIVWYVAFEEIEFLAILFTSAEIFVAIVFLILCECLSQLIQNAYEMKQENELTI